MDELYTTQDGSHSLLSKKYGVSYHSKYGAVQETEHVFIEAAFRDQASHHASLAILEMGFGTGLNALMTLLEAEKRKIPVRYMTVEAFPLPEILYQQLNYVEILDADAYEDLFLKMHRGPWDQDLSLTEHFTFRKQQADLKDLRFPAAYHLIYFDAFAPNAQPELWEQPVLQKMYDALLPGGVLTTYCAKGAVKRCLKNIGFDIEALPGPPGKREMTRARKAE